MAKIPYYDSNEEEEAAELDEFVTRGERLAQALSIALACER